MIGNRGSKGVSHPCTDCTPEGIPRCCSVVEARSHAHFSGKELPHTPKDNFKEQHRFMKLIENHYL